MNNKLKYFRSKIGETQQETAQKLGLSISKYQKAEQGAQGVSDHLKIKMAKYFGTTVGVLFFDETITNSNNKQIVKS